MTKEEIEYQIVQLIGELQRSDAMLRWDRNKTVIEKLRTILGMADHQQVVWLNGAEPPHFEIRGTGALMPDGWKPRTPE